MSRPIRIAFPGAWYHVMNRGRRAEKIYLDEHDYQVFVDLLQETTEAWNVKIAAYSLVPNHYHLLVHTPEGNISRAMRHINGVYTQRFNTRHHMDGQLFRGRYKSILVSGDKYLLQIVHYIHTKPLKAGLVEDLKAYPWSSHKPYLSVAKKWSWIHKEFILNLLSKDKKSQLKAYRRYVAASDEEGFDKVITAKKWPSILGPQAFTDWVKSTYKDIQGDIEIPRAQELLLGTDKILSVVCNHYKVDRNQLYLTKRGSFNEPRCAAIYLIRKLRHDTLVEIGKIFNLDKYSSVSSIIERMKSRMKSDQKLRTRIQKLEKKLRKHHGLT
jgi:REP element-mobilizing transposase RayT